MRAHWLQRKTEYYHEDGTIDYILSEFADGVQVYSQRLSSSRSVKVAHIGVAWEVVCYGTDRASGFYRALRVKQFPLTRGCHGRATNYALAWLRGEV